MMKKNILIALFSILIFGNFAAQVGIGTTTVKASAGLEISDYNNKGFLIPRVNINDINDNLSPILNPAEGSLVYNLGGTVQPGLYIWANDIWDQIADSNSMIGYLVLERKTDYKVLGGLANGTYKNFTDAAFTVVKNDIGGIYNTATGEITVPGKSAYLVSLTFNVKTANESAVNGIAKTGLNLHNYGVRLYNPTTLTQYGKTINLNSVSNSIGKTHIINVSFSFINSSSTAISFMPSIAHIAGGTYENGATISTGVTTNGEITITNMKIDILRGIYVE